MKLIVLNNGFILVLVLIKAIHSTHELLLLIDNGHLPENDCWLGELIVDDVIDVFGVVCQVGLEVLVVEGVIDEDLWDGLCA